MSLDMCILASGSAGNSTILRHPGGAVLIDIGIGPRTAAQRMMGTGVEVQGISAICLTHLDRDHFNTNWLATVLRRRMRIYCYARRVRDLMAMAAEWEERIACRAGQCAALASLVSGFDGRAFEPAPGLRFHAIAFAHDGAGSHGFFIEGFGCRIGYATDLGRVPPQLIDRFTHLDVLALESNYDPQMQRESGRPLFLQRRIMGGSGHLSNEEAFDAVRRILARCERAGHRPPAHIVLLHRSRECNCPRLVRRLFGRDPRIAARLVLTEQFERSEWIRPHATRPLVGEQLVLKWA